MLGIIEGFCIGLFFGSLVGYIIVNLIFNKKPKKIRGKHA